MNLSIILTTVSVSSVILSYLSCKHVIFSQVKANLLLLFEEAKTHGNEDNVLFSVQKWTQMAWSVCVHEYVLKMFSCRFFFFLSLCVSASVLCPEMCVNMCERGSRCLPQRVYCEESWESLLISHHS